jgi:L,D-transpeptidase ErfK/SrfK
MTINTIKGFASVAVAALILTPVICQAEVYEVADSSRDLIGVPQRVASNFDDTFIEIGRSYNLGYEELRSANPSVDPWLPGEGTEIILPTSFILPAGSRQGIVVNIAEYRIYYFFTQGDKRYVATLPASIGRMDWATPLGVTGIVAKARRPTWYPPQSVRDEYAAEGRELASIVPPGPDNPLGEYALRLGLAGYLIHGTNKPAGVGMRVTHGCIRLYPEDIEWLYSQATLQTRVTIVNQPVKFGWRGDDLYIEVHPPLDEASDDGTGMTLITREYVKATGEQVAEVDWELIARAYQARSGLPVKVGSRSEAATEITLVDGAGSSLDTNASIR